MLLLLFVLLIPCVLDSFGFKNETNDYFFYGDWVHLGVFTSVSYRETDFRSSPNFRNNSEPLPASLIFAKADGPYRHNINLFTTAGYLLITLP